MDAELFDQFLATEERLGFLASRSLKESCIYCCNSRNIDSNLEGLELEERIQSFTIVQPELPDIWIYLFFFVIFSRTKTERLNEHDNSLKDAF